MHRQNIHQLSAYPGIFLLFTIILISFSVPTRAQVTTYYGAEKAFMDRCSPAGTAENVQKACDCLMKSITRNMTLQDFNSLEERAERGTLTSAEIEQKKQLIARSKPGLYECMGS